MKYLIFKNKEYKPMLRGWLHLGFIPVVLIMCICLIVKSQTFGVRISSVVFTVSSLMLFVVSAIYHRFVWGEKFYIFVKRWDHSNIFLLIAGSYTPIVVALLSYSYIKSILPIVWIGALFGIAIYLFYPNAPRWVNVMTYIILGWVAIAYIKASYISGGGLIIFLLLFGGFSYSIGSVFYASKFPKNNRYFGYHEIFHFGTILGWLGIYFANYFAVIKPI